MLRLVRFDHWFTQKLSPLLVLAYALLWGMEVTPGDAGRVLPFVLLSICCVAAYGHVVNDWFDIESDQKAGKSNSVAGIAPAVRFLLAALLVVSGFGLLALVPDFDRLWPLLTANYLLPTLYSIPPIRLKERSLAGIVCDALAAHLLPALLVSLALRSIAGQSGDSLWTGLTLSTCLWSSCLGLRGILAHQAMDRAGDIAAGARTFATERSRESIRGMIVRLILPAEALGLAAFVAFLPSYPPAVAIVLGVFAAGEVYRTARGLRMPLIFPEQPGRERYIPLMSNELYEVWLPCGLVWQLAFGGPGYFALPLVHVLLFRKPILRTAAMLIRLAAGVAGRTA
jgi:4-hydroxybenzoate polyprenyltransferase